MLTRAAGCAAAILLLLMLGADASAYPLAIHHTLDRPAAFPSAVAFRREQGGGRFFSRYHFPPHRTSERPARSFVTHRQATSRVSESPRIRFPSWRRPPGSRQASTSIAGYPPRIPPRGGDGGNRPHPPRDPGSSDIWWPIRRSTPLPPVAVVSPPPSAVVVAPAAAAIAGFGGSRPPIAPRFSRGQGQPSSAVAALLNSKRHRAKEVLIEVSSNSTDQLKQALSSQYGVEVRELGSIELINARIWHLTLVRGQALATVLGQLLQDSRVISAQPNYVYTPVQGTGRGSPAAYSETALPVSPVEALPTGGGVKVAIIDTCVDRNHTEIQGAVQSFFDATPSGSRSCEAENHGTAVASLIGGHDQIRGSAPGAELMEARAFTETEEEKEVAATSREIALALDWSARQDARVANLSFAGPSDPARRACRCGRLYEGHRACGRRGKRRALVRAALPGSLSRSDRGNGNRRQARALQRRQQRLAYRRFGTWRGCHRRAC